MHQLAEVFQQWFHLHGVWVQGLFAREGQQALGQKRAAFGGLERAGDTRRIRRVGIDQLQTANDHRQQIVEIVRQPARQLPDRFHFLAVQ
ncbi:hypothetical protein D3C76_1202520 [compost metagenome]